MISCVIFPINKLFNLTLSGHTLVVQFYISSKELYVIISLYHLFCYLSFPLCLLDTGFIHLFVLSYGWYAY